MVLCHFNIYNMYTDYRHYIVYYSIQAYTIITQYNIYTSHLFMERMTCVMWECLQSAAQCSYVYTYWSGTAGDLHIQYALILQ